MSASRAFARAVPCVVLLLLAWVSVAQAVQAMQVSGVAPAQAAAITATQQMAATEGSPVTVTINVGQTCPSLVAIDWGDGNTSTALPCDPSSGSVTATHTYAEEGNDTITVLDPANPTSALQTADVQVGDAQLTSTGPMAGTAVTRQPLTTPVATFSDADPSGTIADYSASINWGDNTSPTSGSIVGGSGSDFSVSDTGTHTYAASGTYNVDVTITDAGGSKIDVSYPMTVSDPTTSSSTSSTSTSTTTTPTTTISSTTTSPAATTMTSSLAPPKYRAAVYGTVKLVQPHLPGNAPASRIDAGAPVTLVLATRRGMLRQTTLTGPTGAYRFANLPPCSPAAGDTCTVSVAAPGGAIGDTTSVAVPDQPSSTRVDLVAGRLSQRFFIAGTVLPPAARSSLTDPVAGSARPASDLTVWVQRGTQLEEIYDGLRGCRIGHWTAPTGKTCASTAGNYLLGQVALPGTAGVLAAVGHSQAKVMLILLEAKRPGGTYVPVDSATLRLPANTASNNANPPLTVAPTLHEVAPVPAFWGGHIVGGRVTKTAKRPTGSRAPAVVGVSRAQVVLIVRTGKHVWTRQTRADRSGYYAFSHAPNCAVKLSCTVALLGGKHNSIEKRQRVTVPSLNPSMTVIDLTAPSGSG